MKYDLGVRVFFRRHGNQPWAELEEAISAQDSPFMRLEDGGQWESTPYSARIKGRATFVFGESKANLKKLNGVCSEGRPVSFLVTTPLGIDHTFSATVDTVRSLDDGIAASVSIDGRIESRHASKSVK